MNISSGKIWDMKTSLVIIVTLCYLAIMMVWTQYNDIHELQSPLPPLLPIVRPTHLEKAANGKSFNSSYVFIYRNKKNIEILK